MNKDLPIEDVGPVDTKAGWTATAIVAILAIITRFWGLTSISDKGTPIFDEKHYAPQAWQVSQYGLEDNPAYGLVVHPPVAKQVAAIGEAIFGYTPMGWRFSAAVCGVITIVIVMRVARRLSRSTQIGVIAALLLICDGVFFVTSRIGMLDVFQVTFIVAAFAALVVDRDQMRERMHKAALAGRSRISEFGPRFGFRWWRFTAGVMLGLSLGVKWSGLYYIAAFGLLSVMWDLSLRYKYGVRRPVVGTLRRDTFPALASLVGIPVVIYILSWLPWFADENSVYRHIAGSKVGIDGPGAILPDAARGLWYYTTSVLEFHSSLTNSAGNHHPWESKPFTWPMSLRPMLYYIEQGSHVTGCGEDSCTGVIMLIGTPAIWWLAIPVLGWAIWRTFAHRDGRYAAVLVGYAAGIVPWFIAFDRQMYFFYAAPLVPFFVIMLALILGQIIGTAKDSPKRRRNGMMIVAVYLGIVVANFIWLWPILTGTPITALEWNNQLWLPSWR